MCSFYRFLLCQYGNEPNDLPYNHFPYETEDRHTDSPPFSFSFIEKQLRTCKKNKLEYSTLL